MAKEFMQLLLLLLLQLFVAIVVAEAIYDPTYTGIKTRAYQRDPLIAQAYEQQPEQHYHGQSYDANPRLSTQPHGSYNSRNNNNNNRNNNNNGNSQDQRLPEQVSQPIYERANVGRQESEGAISEYYTDCPHGHSGPLPYAYDCRRFVNCFRGRGHIQSCGPGTVFNPQTLECDRPDKVLCGATDALGAQAQQQPVYAQQPQRAGRLLDVAPRCPPGLTGLQPHPTDCTKFLNCANGETYVQDCAPGTAYSVAMMGCDYKHKVDCADRALGGADIAPVYANTAKTTSTANYGSISCPPGVAGLVPHPYDRRKYLHCAAGRQTVRIEECTWGAVFDSTSRVCVSAGGDASNAYAQTKQSLLALNATHAADILCPAHVVGHFAHPFDQTKFLNCKADKIAVQSCTAGQVFSIPRGCCVDKTTALYTDYVQYIVSEVSYEYSLLLTSCPPGTDGLHLYPYDGLKYLRCHNGQMSVIDCAQNLGYSISGKACRAISMLGQTDHVGYYWELRAQSTTATQSMHSYSETQNFQSPLTQCPRSLTGRYPYSFDGARYVLCQNGLLQIETCASGQVFSLSKKQCTLRSELALNEYVPLQSDAVGYLNPMEDLTTITCTPDAHGYYLHPFDCTKYLNCRDQQTLIENCAAGTVFSISQRKCIRTDQVSAYDRVDYMTDVQHEFFDESRPKVRPQQHSAGVVTCAPDASGLQAHPFDCTKFLNCANGQTFVQDCGPGTAWSIELEVCDYTHKIDCSTRAGRGLQSAPGRDNGGQRQHLKCPATTYGLFAHPFDNTRYVRCESGQTHVQRCYEGNVFSISRSFCLPQAKVPSTDRVNYLSRVSSTVSSLTQDFLVCPQGFEGAYLYPFDCNKYISCSDGITTILACPPGSHYSISHGTCLTATQVARSDRIYTLMEIQNYSDWMDQYVAHMSSALTGITLRCPAGMLGLYQHPYDPTKFLSCSAREALIFDCPPNAVFSVSRRLCLAQQDVAEHDRCNSFDYNLAVREVSSTSTTHFTHSGGQVKCPLNVDGLQAHPFDCTKFLNCGNGQTFVQDCGPGTARDVRLQVCDHADKVDCGDRRVGSRREGKHVEAADGTQQVACPVGANGVQAHPFDCTKFLNCVDGQTFVQNCGPSTAWNQALETCDFIDKVDCGARTHIGNPDNNAEREPKSYTSFDNQRGSYVTTTTDQSNQPNRWSNMNMQRPAGVGYGQQTSTTPTHGWDAAQQQPSGWSGYGSSVDQRAPSQNVLYVEGSLAPNRNYHKSYNTPLAPFTQQTVPDDRFLTAPTSTQRTSTNAQGPSHGNVYYAQPVGSHELDSDEVTPNHLRQNFSREIRYGVTSNGWRPILRPPQNPTRPYQPHPNTQLMPPYADGDSGQRPLVDNGDFYPGKETKINVDTLPADRQYALGEQDQFPSGSAPVASIQPDSSNLYGGLQPRAPASPSQPLYPSHSYAPPQPRVNQTRVPNPYPNHRTTYTDPRPPANYGSNLYGGLQPPVDDRLTTTPSPPYKSPSQVLQPPNKPTPSSNVNIYPIYPAVANATDSNSPKYPHYSPPYAGVSHAHNESRLGRKLPSLPQGDDTQRPLDDNDRQYEFESDEDFDDDVGSKKTKNAGHSTPERSGNSPPPYNSEFYSTPKTTLPQSRSDDIDRLALSEAMRMLLKPYFNRSGTVDDSAAERAESHIMSLVNSPSQDTTTTTTMTITTSKATTTTATPKPRDSGDDFELILAGEQESLTKTITVPTAASDSKTEFHFNQGPVTETNHNWHGHSRDYHARHPNLINPFDATEPQNSPHSPHSHRAHQSHSHSYHSKHPELPNPFENSNSPHGHPHEHSRSFHERHPSLPNPFKNSDETTRIDDDDELPNPRAEGTTPKTIIRGYNIGVDKRIDLRNSFGDDAGDCEFECGNGKCVKQFEVCDGVNNCANRRDESECAHLGYEVRLTGGDSTNAGRVEVKILGKWGYVCDDKFGLRNADVVCKELGFNLGASEVRGNSYYAPTELNFSFAMDEVECHGNETKLKDCGFKGWGVNNCGPDEVVGVVCKVPQFKCPNNYWLCSTSQECIPLAFVCDNTEDCSDKSDESKAMCNSPVEYRLQGGRSSNEGRLEVKYHGEWGTICDDDFSLKEAQVACNSLGYYGRPKIEKNIFGLGNGPIWLDQVSCYGNETALDKCTHWTWGEHNCNHTEDVGLHCTAGPPPRRTTTLHNVNDGKSAADDADYQTQEDSQMAMEDIGLYSGQWQRSSKFLNNQRRCGHFKDDVEDEYAHPEQRVVNGSVAKRGRHPWQATIRTRGRGGISSHWCGAVLISKRHLLTAAHCLAGYPKGAYFVRLGDHYSNIAESSEVDSYIENWYIHEKFRDKTHMNNDIAVVVLKSPVRFNDYVQPICLPEKGATLADNRMCTISGWGSIKSGVSTPSNILRSAQLPILPDDTCKQPHVYGVALTEGMFCAGSMDESVDACDGDSGGPLVCSDNDGETLYGIISWGQHCGYINKPGVYVRVERYIDWIYEKINFSLQQQKGS